MKKIEVYVVVDTPKKAKKLKRVLDMFVEKVYEDSVWHNDGYPYYSIDYDREYWVGDSLKDSEDLKNKIEVSIKELRNILAMEYLKEGDVALFEDKGYKVLGRYKKYSDAFKDFVCDKIEGNSSTTTGLHNFIRYATEEEKELLEPKKEMEVGKWYKGEFGDVWVLAFFQGVNVASYGVHSMRNEWFEEHFWFNKRNISMLKYREATPQEVEMALIEEAKSRGVFPNTKLTVDTTSIYNHGRVYDVITTDKCFRYSNNLLEVLTKSGAYTIFKDGKWATIIEQDNFTDSDIAIVERLHDALLDNHGYSLESKLLTDARMLASKIKSNIK